MTRKDYQLIANVLKAHTPSRGVQAEAQTMLERAWTLRNIALTFAHELASENPRFDRAKFLRACGLSD
jgi:hypothetical protein